MAQKYVKKFKAKLNGKTIDEIMSKLDYTISDFDSRIKIVKEICEDEYFIEYFDNYFKVSPNTTDQTSIDDNICNSLERVADYLLFSELGKKEDEIVVLNYSKQIRISKIENTSIEQIQEDSDIEDIEPRKDLNYKKSIIQVIKKDDLKKDNYLKELQEIRDEISQKNKIYKDNLNSGDKAKENFYISRKLNSIIKSIDYSMTTYKDSVFGTIYFKRVMPDSTDMQDFMIDFKEISHIQALLECKPVPVLSNKWYSYASFALEEMLKNTKHKIKQEDLDILEIVRLSNDCTYNDILTYHGLSKTHIRRSLNRIAKIINKHYLDICEDLWYLNMVKGTYKKCSKCGEVKLISKFYVEKKVADGLKAECKECSKK